MKRYTVVNPYVEDLLLWASARGSFSYLNPFGNKKTVVRKYDGEWKFVDVSYYREVIQTWLLSDLR